MITVICWSFVGASTVVGWVGIVHDRVAGGIAYRRARARTPLVPGPPGFKPNARALGGPGHFAAGPR